MDRNNLFGSCDGVRFCKKKQIFTSYARGNRRIYINLTTEALAFATDYCGVKSGKDLNKFEEMHLTPEMGMLSWAPMIKESPVCIACEVVRIEELGSHDMFIANVKGVYADEAYMDEKGKFDMNRAG